MEQVIDNWRARLARSHMADRNVGDAFIWNHETRATGSHADVRTVNRIAAAVLSFALTASLTLLLLFGGFFLFDPIANQEIVRPLPAMMSSYEGGAPGTVLASIQGDAPGTSGRHLRLLYDA